MITDEIKTLLPRLQALGITLQTAQGIAHRVNPVGRLKYAMNVHVETVAACMALLHLLRDAIPPQPS